MKSVIILFFFTHFHVQSASATKHTNLTKIEEGINYLNKAFILANDKKKCPEEGKSKPKSLQLKLFNMLNTQRSTELLPQITELKADIIQNFVDVDDTKEIPYDFLDISTDIEESGSTIALIYLKAALEIFKKEGPIIIDQETLDAMLSRLAK